tara:strand:- start:450 stop:590 length:141 start_codon:yes stop_codon:yes gene_type:complete
VIETKMKPNQIEFVEMVVKELMQNGVMEASRLFNRPRTSARRYVRR